MATSPTQPQHTPNLPPPSATDRRRLTPKQRLTAQQARFVREYVIDFNPQRAAKTAGYGTKSLSSISYTLLQIPKIQDEIERIHTRELEKTSQIIARQVRETCRIAFSDPGLLFDEDGRPIPIPDLPDDVRHAVASYELDKAGNVIKIKLWSKTEALAQLGKYTGILSEQADDARNVPAETKVTITLVQAPPRRAAEESAPATQPGSATIQQPQQYGTAEVEVKLITAGDSNTP